MLKVLDLWQAHPAELRRELPRTRTRDVTYDDIAPAGAPCGRGDHRGGGAPQFAVIAASQDGAARRRWRPVQRRQPRGLAARTRASTTSTTPRTAPGRVWSATTRWWPASRPSSATVDASENGSDWLRSPSPPLPRAARTSWASHTYRQVTAGRAQRVRPAAPGAVVIAGLAGPVLSRRRSPGRPARPGHLGVRRAWGVRAPVATDTLLVGVARRLVAGARLPAGGPSSGALVSCISGGVGEGVLPVLRQQLQAQNGLDFDRDACPRSETWRCSCAAPAC